MKNITFYLIIIFMPLLLQSQDSQTKTDDIDIFDRQVAQMKPIPHKMDVNVQVIGLEIRKGSSIEKQLSKVANAGGGHYNGVQDAKNLSRIFTRVTSAQNNIPASNILKSLSVGKQEKLGMALVKEGRKLEKAGDINGAIIKYQKSFKYQYKIDQLIALRVMHLKKTHNIK